MYINPTLASLRRKPDLVSNTEQLSSHLGPLNPELSASLVVHALIILVLIIALVLL